MPKTLFTALVIMALAAVAKAGTIYIAEDFSSEPTPRWVAFGDSNLFSWNATSQNLHVTWDSAKQKSFFYVPLGKAVSRYDSFTIEFDLLLNDIVSGNEEFKTGPMQIGIGFLNIEATNSSWSRVEWLNSPNVAEFNCYPSGFYPGWPIEATMAPSFVSSNGYRYAPKWLDDYIVPIPLHQVIHVKMDYHAETQVLSAVWTTNGVPVGRSHELVLSNPADSQFTEPDDFQVNIFSISNYKSREGDYADSVLAHGSVDNVQITIPPPPPICLMRGSMEDGNWKVRFHSVTGWSYLLERTQNFKEWTDVGTQTAGTGSDLVLDDSNPPREHSFYRVRATQ